METRRKHPRHPCSLPCRIRIGTTVCDARVVHVSLEGVYLESELMMDEGSVFVLEIEAGGPEAVAVEAELMHWRHLRPEADGEDDLGLMGYGVQVGTTRPFRDLVEELAAAAAD